MSAALATAAFYGPSGQAHEHSAGATQQSVRVSAEQLLAFADQARATRDFAAAETAYRALAGDPDIELRTEARFRLAIMFADDLGRHRDAAVLFREILDEKPGATRVRVELARMQAMLGDLRAAERELRSAQAAGLPPEVEQQVRFLCRRAPRAETLWRVGRDRLRSRQQYQSSHPVGFRSPTPPDRAGAVS